MSIADIPGGLIEGALGALDKFSSKRFLGIAGAGAGVYALTAAGLLAGPLGGGILAGLAVAYLIAETWRPSGNTPPAKPPTQPN